MKYKMEYYKNKIWGKNAIDKFNDDAENKVKNGYILYNFQLKNRTSIFEKTIFLTIWYKK